MSNREQDPGVVIVTGGSRGIGAEIAVSSAMAGHDVIIGYVDEKKKKRADAVISRIESVGQSAIAVRADITSNDEAGEMLNIAQNFAREKGQEISTLVLNAAGGLEAGAGELQARQINASAPLWLAMNLLYKEQATGNVSSRKDIVYVTSNPSHFLGHPSNTMPSDVYNVVAESKHLGEKDLRQALAHPSEGMERRLLVATADLVNDTAGATLLKMAHRREVGDNSADLLAERDQELHGLIGRGITNAVEFGKAIVSMFEDDSLPSGHTLYMPRPVLEKHVVDSSELPFNLSDPSMHTFAQ